MARFPFVSVRDGKLVVENDKGERAFALDMEKAIFAYFMRKRISCVVCSSSVDFPQEHGAPEGLDVRALIDRCLYDGDKLSIEREMFRALGVIVKCPAIVYWLANNDPMALKQARDAYGRAEDAGAFLL